MTSQTQPSSQTSRPQGYLKEEFRFFHLKDLGKGPYEYHHHDFLKILILINGNVSYSIEGRSYRLMPWDMVLVDRGQIHRPEPDPSCPYERLILYLSPAFLEAHKHADSDLALCFSTASYRHSQVLRFAKEELRPMAVLLKQLENETNSQKGDFASPLFFPASVPGISYFTQPVLPLLLRPLCHHQFSGLPGFRTYGPYQQPSGRRPLHPCPGLCVQLKPLPHDACF